MKLLIFFLAFFSYNFSNKLIFCLDNGLALTPPMGWMSWERFRCTIDCRTHPNDCISENLFKRTADLMVSEGYLDAGYEYIIIDDCWMADTRDDQGRLQPNAERFPNGIRNLSDYIHSLGLKFGIYEDIGEKTCAGYPGIDDNLDLDAQTFADWGVDYVKVDGCYMEQEDLPIKYPEFTNSLNKTGRNIVYSCSWPAYDGGIKSDYDSISSNCNLWRNYGDIEDDWGTVKSIIDFYGDYQDIFAPYAGPGHWNDPDMLIIGNFGLDYEKSKAQMAIWAILAAPLIMSNDLATVGQNYKEILQNKEVISINQDPLGIQGKRISKNNKTEVWVKPLKYPESSAAVVILNLSKSLKKMSLNFTEILEILPSKNGYFIKDIFDNYTISEKPQELVVVEVKPTGVVLLKVTAAN